jgi:hypothetical protein
MTTADGEADKSIEKVSAPAQTGARRVKVRLFRLRNKLKEKAGVGRANAGDSTIATEALERALSEMKKSQEDYPDWVKQTLNDLADDLKAASEKDEVARQRNFKHIGALAHELKGQGGTFGYPLISVFGKSLNEFTEKEVGYITDNHLEIVKAHIDVMRAVIKDRISGDGGNIGRELIMVLERAIKKYDSPAMTKR